MSSHSGQVLALGLLTFVASGCGGADPSAPIMVESKHSHYHVHAVDASHEHTHQDGALGGHAHSHQHPHAEHNARDHANHDAGHQKGMLIVKTKPAVAVAGKPVALDLMIHRADGTMVREFDVTHEKLVHLIVVREGLDEFAHVHPTVDDQGNLSISHTFPKAGKYRLYADHKPKDKSPALATAQIEVKGEPSPAPALVVDASGEVSADGIVARVDLKDAKAGDETEVRFRLTNESGKPLVDLQPYLGARGHLVVISADGERYVHAHPTDASSVANEVVFMSHFPGAGIYKGWAQFQVAEQVRTVPFVVQIR